MYLKGRYRPFGSKEIAVLRARHLGRGGHESRGTAEHSEERASTEAHGKAGCLGDSEKVPVEERRQHINGRKQSCTRLLTCLLASRARRRNAATRTSARAGGRALDMCDAIDSDR